MISDREKGLVHIYPAMAGMSTIERRQVMVAEVGCFTSKELSQRDYERAMARFEEILWDRVDRGLVPDPRLCRKCGRPLRRLPHNRGACPEGCETRSVCAWDRDYWRRRLPREGQADTRQRFKLKTLWFLLLDRLSPEEQSDAYLAGIIAHANGPAGPEAYLQDGKLDWDRLTSAQTIAGIEAIKDLLAHERRPERIPAH